MTEYAVLLVFDSPILDRFLMVRHAERGWELPGGLVEPGETPLAAARREWREETRLPLALLEPLALHDRPDGSLGHLFLGAARTAPDAGLEHEPASPEAEEKIVGLAWLRRLDEATPLAFPDDPYAALAGYVLDRLDGGPWRLPAGEDPAGFRARLAEHPAARPRPDGIRPVVE